MPHPSTTVPSASDARQATDAALSVLRQGGQRVTPARRSIIEMLASTRDHLTADHIASLLERAGSDVHRATVYRTLDALVQRGVISHVHLPHGATTYHLTQSRVAGHLHLVCRSCGAVVDAPADLLDDATSRAVSSLGFRLDPDHVALTGWCRTCAVDQ